MPRREVDWRGVGLWLVVTAVLVGVIYLAVTRLPGRTSSMRDRDRTPQIQTPTRPPPAPPAPISPR